MDEHKVQAWLLYAVSFAPKDRPASLAAVIRTADGIAHTPPSKAELATGFGALVGRGLITQSPEGFALTPAGAELVSQWLSEVPEGHWGLVEAGAKAIADSSSPEAEDRPI